MSQYCNFMCRLVCQTGLFTVQSLAQLFQRCLMKVLHIDLWKCYLSYVRETKGKLPSYKYVIQLCLYGFKVVIKWLYLEKKVIDNTVIYRGVKKLWEHNSIWDSKSRKKLLKCLKNKTDDVEWIGKTSDSPLLVCLSNKSIFGNEYANYHVWFSSFHGNTRCSLKLPQIMLDNMNIKFCH